MADTTYQLNFTGDQINNLLTRTNNLDTELNNYLLKNGGDMTGGINMNGNKITDLGNPTSDRDAVPKAYAVDMKLVVSTLLAAGWVNGSQTVAAEGVTADDTMTAIITTAAANSVDTYLDSGIKCVGQGNGTLTFTCTTTPGIDIIVNLIILKKGGWAS